MSIFSNVAGRKTKRSKFDLSKESKLSFNMGKLIPVMNQEIVPGDKFRVNSEVMMRFSPLIAPIMHRVNVYMHYFFVPNRIVWTQWEDFITGGQDGTSVPEPPTMIMNETYKSNFTKGRVPDYMGLPVLDDTQTIIQNARISAIPFRAYHEIWNEYYRDPNLQQEVAYDKGSGGIPANDYPILTALQNRAWEKDYFTSALPWAQRGAASELPIDNQVTYKPAGELIDGLGVPSDGTLNSPINAVGSNAAFQVTGVNGPINIDNIDSISSQLTINDLRKSARLQEWLERSARGGYRYIEQILAHFGVRSSDKRLQRPEYLGGGKQPVVVSEVLSTAGGTNLDGPQGSMSGHAISVGSDNSFQKSFEEHGYVIGIMSVIPKTAYQNGIERHWSRATKFDYYWPEFAQLGEQEVLNREIFYNGLEALDNEKGTFGYQSRYSEYKYNNSSVHGDFRESLNHWHLGRIFTQTPLLNGQFTTSFPRNDIFAVTDPDAQKLWCQIYHRIDAIRPMPYFNNPTL